MSCKGFVYNNNPLLVMAKIKLIESLHSIKCTTMRYNGLKIKTITYWLYSSLVDLTTNSR